ncbi:MAG: beta-ketoacyl-[acyl-carrier-protein] synthase II [Candidatus Omnitrophica bacterium CG08_land_8_20_14_0_20_41_16]|uniref:3-oxoacyl-[acyl-carrier-protein] synthase 2 n=1 Tax=Candidatus Sherwoodlollariibacterium unditelluris TaxID=1974757 RepID=A0A2G9YJ53_9BACT|nr:MAG: beta-ketoacyl-[acyl-carrier-protein] synthase II [Candidatus Omnitrophica bacterium CG23_combo_of_CG06-09_8_20_14_all_41_10]PIS33685.1 MAG: beta-ketoacyl-[acyl-carrier-protein] synthase II [Candidatus Omnitrophica bacterium CG08_land_8_20_14_0_20_41_16]
MENRVVITGSGVISPVGNDVSTFWDSLKKGKGGVGPLISFDAADFDSRIAGEVKGFDPSLYGMDFKDIKHTAKFVQYAVASTKQAIDSSGLDLNKENRERIGVLIGSGIGSLQTIEEEHKVFLNKGPSRLSPFLIPMLIVNEASGFVGITFGLKGPNFCVATACASGSHAIGNAFRILERGDADVIISGGTESCVVATAVGGFCALRALSQRNNEPAKASRPFDRDRDGFIIAEGCGLVVMETLEHAKKRKAQIIAEIVGFGMTCDAYHITAPDPDGEGAGRAMSLALADAKLNPEDVDYINAHGTSTKLNDKIETFSMKRAFGAHAKKVMVSSTKSMTGHLLGAAGGVEFIACCLAIRDGIIPPTINYEYPDPECDLDYVPNIARKVKVEVCMSNSLGFGGHNASLIVRKFKE